MNISKIHDDMWAQLVRQIQQEAPADATKADMTLAEYLRAMYHAGRKRALARKEAATDGAISRQCEIFDDTRREEILSEVILPTDQDALHWYDNAHVVNYAGKPNGYSLQNLLWYFIDGWPQIKESILSGRVPDVPPFKSKPTPEIEDQAPSPAGSSETPVDMNNVPDDALFSPADIATISGVKQDALRKRLERLRRDNHNSFVENEGRKQNEPEYLYKAVFVRPIVKDMKEKQASDETSSKRPARKK